MQLSLSFPTRVSKSEADPVTTRLQTVLLAAKRTPFYARKLHGGSDALSPNEMLARMPVVDAKLFLENRASFTDSRAPLALVPGPGLRVFSHAWRRRLGLPVEAIEGTQAELAALANDVEAGRSAVPNGVRRLLVSSRLGSSLMLPELRDRLWQVFELPVFEQLRGFEGELLASECDVHDGLHLEPEAAFFESAGGELVVTPLQARRHPVLRVGTGLNGQIDNTVCACGKASARWSPAAVAVATRKPPVLAQEGRSAGAAATSVAVAAR